MRFLLLPLLLLWPVLGSAEVYRWVDAQGKVHYTQTKPPDANYKAVPPAPPPGALGGSPNLGGYASKMQGDRLDREQNQARQEREAAQRQARCSSARSQASVLKNYEGRIFTPQEDGGRERWTPEQHAAERERAEAAIAENCNK